MYVVKRKKTTYWRYVEEPFVQPVLSANGTMGGDKFACDSSAPTDLGFGGGPQYAYYAFDDRSFMSMGAGFAKRFSWYNPVDLNISKIEMNWSGIGVLQYSADNINWVTLKTLERSTDDTSITTIDLSSYNVSAKYWRIYNSSTAYDSMVIHNMKIMGNAQSGIIEVPEGEPYDYTEEVVRLYLAKVKKRTYYKNKPWMQPVLIENGVLGGEGFAILSSKGAANDYVIFNSGASGTAAIDTLPNAAPQWLIFYNGEPLKVRKIQIGQNKSNELNNYYIQSYEIQASDDNVEWERVFSASSLTPQQILTAEIPDSGYHKYYRVYVSAAKYYSGYPRVFFVGITIDEAYTREEATADDYDFFVEEVRQYVARRKIRRYYKYGEFIKVGSPTIVDGVVSGFSADNYLKFSQVFNPGNSYWEQVWKIKTGNDITARQHFTCIDGRNNMDGRGVTIALQNSAFQFLFSINNAWYSTTFGAATIKSNTVYWVKMLWNGDNYKLQLSTNGLDFTDYQSFSVSTPISPNPNPDFIGIGWSLAGIWSGSIDLSESYIKIDNNIWWQGSVEVSATDDWDYYIDEEL